MATIQMYSLKLLMHELRTQVEKLLGNTYSIVNCPNQVDSTKLMRDKYTFTVFPVPIQF